MGEEGGDWFGLFGSGLISLGSIPTTTWSLVEHIVLKTHLQTHTYVSLF